MTISISSLVIGCGLLFLAGVFTGISIMCMLSVRKNRRLNENYFVSDSDTRKGRRKHLKQRKKFIMLCGLMLAVSSPTYAENATEAVSVSDTGFCCTDIGC